MKQSIEEAAYDYATEKTKFRKDVLKEVDADNYVSRHADCMEDFQCGAEWEAKQNPWHNFKDERPKPNSHILRKMIHPDYQSYGKTIYYADFWGEDRPDKWEQDTDRVVYEWQYINK